ncbi:MAG: glycosyltransferase family 39 protein [Acidobacteria bacterium]|nr:glycosyltransferase family 39 protein [Acidobacteriota bacterium]
MRAPKVAAPAPSLADRLTRSPARYLAIFTLIYILAECCQASRRRFIFDELMTSALANLPDIRQIWPLIARGMELNPPLTFWLAWILRHAIGEGEVVSRLPAVAGFWLMCLCLYAFVRRRSTPAYGFIALLLPLFTFTAWHSTLSRGYGLMLGASALALLAWQLAADGVRRGWALASIATGVAIAISSHYYSVYVALAIGLGEIARAWERRRLDPAIFAALALGLSPLAAYRQLLGGAAHHATTNFWASPADSPTADFLYESYAGLLGPVMIIVLALLVIALWRRSDQAAWAPQALTRPEIVACAALAAMPLIVFCGAMLGPVPFYTRYVQPVVIGFTILATMFLHRIAGNSRRVTEISVALVVWCCFTPWTGWQACKLIAGKRPAAYLEFSPKLPLAQNLPIVFDGESIYLEYFHYSPPEIRRRIHALLNPQAAVRYWGSDTTQRSLLLAQATQDFHAADYHRFLAANSEFLLMRVGGESWLPQALLAEGARLQLLSLDKNLGYFEQAATVYRVTLPPAALAKR